MMVSQQLNTDYAQTIRDMRAEATRLDEASRINRLAGYVHHACARSMEATRLRKQADSLELRYGRDFNGD